MSLVDAVAAQRYAQALFGAAVKTGEIDKVHADLKDLEVGFEPSGLKRFLGDPQYRAEEKRKAIRAVGTKLKSELTTAFIELLLRKHRLDLLEDAARRYGELAEDRKGIVHAEVRLARKAPQPLAKKIEDALVRITKKKVSLNVQVHPEMIGGIVVRMKHYLLDTSVTSRLREIENRLLEVSIL